MAIAIVGPASIIPFPDVAGIALALAQIVLSAKLVDDFYKEYKTETKAIRKGMDFQDEVSDWYHEFYITQDEPQRLLAITHALDMSIPVPDPVKYHAKNRAQIRALFQQANDMPEAMMSGSCLDAIHEKDQRITAEIERMTAVSSHAGISREQDEQFTYLQKRTQSILTGLQMANRPPTAVFNEIGNYLNVHQGLASMASGGFNGALGTMGVSLGQLANAVG